MKLKLKVKEYLITGKLYYRVHFSVKQARALGLQKDDNLIVEVIELQRAEFKPVEFKETTLTEIIA